MAVDTVMTKAEMKKLLNRSKEEPVSCAIGLGDDAGVGLLLLHRTKPGRAVEALLKEAVPAAKNTRWGTAFVDLEDNPKLVKLTLNKPVSGMARKLVKTLKGTGFTKVVILSEDGAAMDDYEEADQDLAGGAPGGEAAGGVPAAPPPPLVPLAAGPTAEDKAAQAGALARALAALLPGIAAAAGGDAARKGVLDKLARDAGVNLKMGNLAYAANFIAQLKAALGAAPAAPAAGPPAVATPEEKAAQAATLARALAGLVAGIAAAAGGDPARKAALDKLAREAGVNIKTGNPAYAANAIAQLKAALAGAALAGTASVGAAPGVAAAAPAAAAPAADVQALAASRTAWTGLRSRVETDLGSLRQALASTYAESAAAGEIASRFQAKAGPLLARFDARLAGALDAMAAEADPARREALKDAASALVAEYGAFAEGDAFLADVDANPFVPLELRAAARGALAEVARGLGG